MKETRDRNSLRLCLDILKQAKWNKLKLPFYCLCILIYNKTEQSSHSILNDVVFHMVKELYQAVNVLLLDILSL